MSLETLELEAQRLLASSIAAGTRSTYTTGIRNFEQFRISIGLGCLWPAPEQHVIAFIANMSLDGKAASTIDTYIAALSYKHKVNGWLDPSNNFLIKKLREGCRRQNRNSDLRRPITIPLLRALCSSLAGICHSSFEEALFRAAFSLAFFGFMRVGEFTADSKMCDTCNILALNDLALGQDGSHLEVNIRKSKTDQCGVGTLIRIETSPYEEVCAVKNVVKFVGIRPPGEGPLFIHFGGDPLTRSQFNTVLKKGVSVIGLNPSDFSTHSFRIGAATSAALGGMSVEKIQEMGRWRSRAVNSYIRPTRVVIPGTWTT